MKILNGTDPKDIPQEYSRQAYHIDWRQAKKNGYKVSTLPDGFEVVNLTFRDRYPRLFLVLEYGGLFFSFVMVIVVLYLLMRLNKQKKAARQQMEHDNLLYSMVTSDNLTFTWERVGNTVKLRHDFWEYYKQTPHDIDVNEFKQMIHPDFRDAYDYAIENSNKGHYMAVEVRGDFDHDGRYHWYLIRGKGILDHNGHFLHSYGMLQNIDQFKEREAEMEEARRMAEEATLKESFLANMSHEIRTPLNAIVGFSNLILQPDADFSPEEKKMFADTINTNNELLLKLINDILDVSRIESGEMKFVIKYWSVQELVEKVYNTFKVQMPQHLDFRLVQSRTYVAVKVDDSRLQQVLGNFLTNAGKFTHEGSITLGWEYSAEDDRVELYVEDTGIGMDEDDCKMVFNRFYKKDEFKQGTGLGLSICKAIVVRLGGKIAVKSELGKGSRFSVFLPGYRGG